jgi:hypothetical protein
MLDAIAWQFQGIYPQKNFPLPYIVLNSDLAKNDCAYF